MTTRENQILLFDADDTLWENNVYFEQAIEQFTDFLEAQDLSRTEIRSMFDAIERETLATHGYGAVGFAHSLRAAWIQISGDNDSALAGRAEQLGLDILQRDIELIAGVEETLAALRPRHELVLVTKGNLDEQQAKIARAPIADQFEDHVIVAEKTADVYRKLLDDKGYDPSNTWMIGNSPKSDINPALEAGMNAVFIPHAMTWHMEHMDITDQPEWRSRLVEVASFRDLLSVFAHD